MITELKNLTIDGVLIEYFLTYKPVKRLTAKVRCGKIYVSANPKVHLKQIEDFLLKNKAWVFKALTPRQEVFYYQGKKYSIRYEYSSAQQVVFYGGTAVIYAKDKGDAQSVVDNFYAEQVITPVYSALKKYLPIFIKEYGITVPKFIFKKYRSKWGSCNGTKTKICFNTLLAKVPIECVEYVVCHELSHLVEMNHQKSCGGHN